MSTRNRKKPCAYCGQEKKLTADHVPPKLFLERPWPANLFTVPSCADCNLSFKLDDEYTRTVLATDIRATWNYAAQSNLSAIMRSLQRPNARAFAEYISQQSHLLNVLAPDGNPVLTVEFDRQRINRSGLHILRGLYFRETGNRLSGQNADVRLGSKAGLTHEHSQTLTIARVFRLFPDQRNGATGTAFSYAAAFGDRRSVWLMLLYDYFFWVGTVDERDASEREAGGTSESNSPSRMFFV